MLTSLVVCAVAYAAFSYAQGAPELQIDASALPAQAVLVTPASFAVLGNNGTFRTVAFDAGFNPTGKELPFFQVFDNRFLKVLGKNANIASVASNATLRLRTRLRAIYDAKQDIIFFASNDGGPLGMSDIDHNNVVGFITLKDVPNSLNGTALQVPVTELALPDTIQMTNGGTGPLGGNLVLINSGRGNLPPSVVLVNSRAPHNATVLLDNYYGRQFNSLNDAKIHPSGAIFFTDTTYGWLNHFRPLPGMPSQVYRLDPVTRAVRLVATDFTRCNGIAFNGAGTLAYVSDTGLAGGFTGNNQSDPSTIYAYDVHPTTQAFMNRRAFAFIDDGVPDGLQVDSDGNVYSGCGDGVQVWAPDGTLIGKFFIGTTSANMAFAGPGRLIILAETAVYVAHIAARIFLPFRRASSLVLRCVTHNVDLLLHDVVHPAPSLFSPTPREYASASPNEALASIRPVVLSCLSDLETRLAKTPTESASAAAARDIVRALRDDAWWKLHRLDRSRHSMLNAPARLRQLHALLVDMDMESEIAGVFSFEGLALDLPVVANLLDASGVDGLFETQDDLEEAVALARSRGGERLLDYDELPQRWRNNPYVVSGYRFIPLSRWCTLLASVFRLHNETANIYTHLVPLILWGASFAGFWMKPGDNSIVDGLTRLLSFLARALPVWMTHDLLGYTPFFAFTTPPSSLPSSFFASPYPPDAAENIFTVFALFTLTCSVVWHTMSGCSHRKAVDICARLDYIGIGWLTAVSISTAVHHAFACGAATEAAAQCSFSGAVRMLLSYHPLGLACIALNLACGLAGNILPFCDWFNRAGNRAWRVSFFVGIALASLAPMASVAALRGWTVMAKWVAPCLPCLVLYFVGLLFYAAHFPERLLGTDKTRRGRLARFVVDECGLTSHAIWHVIVVFAMRAHLDGIRQMRAMAAEDGCVAVPQ
ncbi:SGL domain-containing protein [Mycena kentingensis (nom. inval.)]|nr:SGL domain-containing protein [Mycena kentingensis (nom. inval.)]